jgi:hypothetical protein
LLTFVSFQLHVYWYIILYYFHRNEIEPSCSDPLLVGSGSDKSISDENTERPLHSSKAKIHPMDKGL